MADPGAADAGVLGARTIEVLEDLGRAGSLVRLADGPHAGAEVVVPAAHLRRAELIDRRSAPGPSAPGPSATATAAARERAEALLRSLLRPSQRHQRAEAGTFWVHVPAGWFRLGGLYDIRFRAARWPWVERSICVVSEGFDARPTADLWAELTVVLGADARAVVDVANWNGEDPPRPPASTAAGLRRWLEAVRAEVRARRGAGDELHAAYAAFDAAHRLRVVGRRSWAAGCAAAAARMVQAWADRWPDEGDHLLAAHACVFELSASMTAPTPAGAAARASAPPPQRGR